LAKRCTNFTQEPEARTNAVTLWYVEGCYIDTSGCECIERPSTEWKRRDLMKVNNWFITAVTDKSPNAILALEIVPKLATGQMRCIVRFGK
jgi:hypothetical protein